MSGYDAGIRPGLWAGLVEEAGVPLQNRVTPYGEIVSLPGRGLVMGNRGLLHDTERRIVRCSQVRRWIACRLVFGGRHREVMRPRSYTELFFLDETTALSAGHRPCAECRNADYKRFRTLWERCFGAPIGANGIDRVLHAERLDGSEKRTYRTELSALPGGTYIELDGTPWLLDNTVMSAWSADGYSRRRLRPASGEVTVLTPPSIVQILAAGYQPLIHPSAIAPVPAQSGDRALEVDGVPEDDGGADQIEARGLH